MFHAANISASTFEQELAVVPHLVLVRTTPTRDGDLLRRDAVAHLDASPGRSDLARVSALPAWADPEVETFRRSAPRAGHEHCPECERWLGLALRGRSARQTVEYAGGPGLGRLVSGDVVTLTDPDLDAREAVAVVHEVTSGPGETTVTLVLVDPVR